MNVYRYLVMAHLLGASAWIGGHLVLLGVVLPGARRAGSVAGVLEFEHRFGRIGLLALVVQVASGALLATRWIDDWRTIFSAPTPAGHLIIAKIVLLALIMALARHATRRVLPALTATTLGRFAFHAWVVTALSVLLLVCGVGVRTGGLVP